MLIRATTIATCTAKIGSGEVIIDILSKGRVRLSDRADAVRGRVTRSEVKKALLAAEAAHPALLALLKEAAHK
jgi:hypothetical protein